MGSCTRTWPRNTPTNPIPAHLSPSEKKLIIHLTLNPNLEVVVFLTYCLPVILALVGPNTNAPIPVRLKSSGPIRARVRARVRVVSSGS